MLDNNEILQDLPRSLISEPSFETYMLGAP